MNWEAIGAIGEIVGAIAVVATLAYLATQVRYARLAASDNSRQNRTQGILDLELAYLNNSDFRSAWDNGEGNESLEITKDVASTLGTTIDETRLIIRGATTWAWLHWAQYHSIKTEKDAKELENIVREFYSIRPVSVVWQEHPWVRSRFDSEFTDWVDSLIAEKETNAKSDDA